MQFHVTLPLILSFCSGSGKKINADDKGIDLEKYSIDADWSKMLEEGKEQNAGAYDTGKQSRINHAPLEAFIPVDPHHYFTASGKCAGDLACDPRGKNPCCSPFGWCGNSNDFCRCLSTVTDSGEELGPCRDFRENPSLIIKKKGYESYYKSDPRDPLPVTLFWKFPFPVYARSFSFQVAPGQSRSAPLRYRLEGSNDASCENATAKRRPEWRKLFQGGAPSSSGSAGRYEGKMLKLVESRCVGVKIVETSSGTASVRNFRMKFVNRTAIRAIELEKKKGVSFGGKKTEKESESGCGGFCIGMIFLGIFVVVAIVLAILFFCGCFRRSERVDDNRNMKYKRHGFVSSYEDTDYDSTGNKDLSPLTSVPHFRSLPSRTRSQRLSDFESSN